MLLEGWWLVVYDTPERMLLTPSLLPPCRRCLCRVHARCPTAPACCFCLCIFLQFPEKTRTAVQQLLEDKSPGRLSLVAGGCPVLAIP